MSTVFKDHFSGHAADYARFRPRYPAELFAWLAVLPSRRERAWDCATGSGQAAVALAQYFKRVDATDASAEQVAHAAPHAGVHYAVGRAEAPAFGDGCMDLIAIAQSLHWFDLDAFYAQARRVLAPGGIVAVWGYELFRVDDRFDRELHWFYREVVGPYWPPERAILEAGYRTLPFPFREIEAPRFEMRAVLDFDGVLGYLDTWSAVKRYQQARDEHPFKHAEARLRAAWGGSDRREVRTPIFMRVGRAD